MKNKCTLIIDGNWLLNSRMAIMMDKFDKSLDKASLQAAQAELTDRIARSIVFIINKLPVIDNIILVSDGGSWRKNLVKPVLAQDITYKGNRKLSVEKDWNYIFGALNDIGKRCEELGITYSRFLNIEGDDWCWYWSRRLNEEGTNCIIWSIDNDLKQLVQVHNGAFTAWYCNDKTGLYLHEDLKEQEMDDIEYFMCADTESPTLTGLKKAAGNVTYIDPNSVILSKIICGDSGDNIKSVIRRVKGSKTYRINEKTWNSIAKKRDIHDINLLYKNWESQKDNLISELLERYPDVDNVCWKNVQEMLEYNTKLVWLNEAVIPGSVIATMNEAKYKLYDLNYIKNNYKVLTNQNDEVESLFEGIEF